MNFYTSTRSHYKSTLPKIHELEEKTADHWLSLAVIWVTETGSENSYYTDEFGNLFYCKNYPR